jgi:hypothetical protein
MADTEKSPEWIDLLIERANAGEHSPRHMSQYRNRFYACICYTLLGSLFTSLLWSVGVISVLSQSHNVSNPQSTAIRLLHCNDSPQGARAMGCKFQIYSYAWVPEPCYDNVLQQEWLEVRDWEYYTDKYKKGKIVNLSVALSGEETLYSTWGQHIEHCAFTWRKFIRSQTGSGVKLTDLDLSYRHVHHCSDALKTRDEHPWDAVNTKLKVEYHMC